MAKLKFKKPTSHDFAVRRTIIALEDLHRNIGELGIGEFTRLLKEIPEETLTEFNDSQNIDWSLYE